jgi:hypothetical protein
MLQSSNNHCISVGYNVITQVDTAGVWTVVVSPGPTTQADLHRLLRSHSNGLTGASDCEISIMQRSAKKGIAEIRSW